jgi:RNA polymerase sigma factor (sigma-70 family)
MRSKCHTVTNGNGRRNTRRFPGYGRRSALSILVDRHSDGAIHVAARDITSILNQIRRMADGGGSVSDAQLLDRFASFRDEAAFELLLWRHAPMVFGTCRRITHDTQDAEDALQATFLALARKAKRISKGASVASWLYKVAFRAALTARARRVKQAVRERTLTGHEDAAAPADRMSRLEREDLRAVLDQELNDLPERFERRWCFAT